ncbi:hypothetical protein QBC41DRAFT_305729 [Cercophora samala]|uniref:Uncharacterized protein n=1 Tax=Cercophora samala TaxID=330535 RepID=A0AA39Z873_9PEZI|nr:hypothetical protein QBC41DRAFT_305729 [Cercophora samala]
MAATYDQGPEPARHDYPEVTDPSHFAPEYVPPQPQANEPIKPYGTYVTVAPYELSSGRAPSTFGGHAAAAPPYNIHDQPAGSPMPVSPPGGDPSSSMNSEKPLPRRGKTIFGCTTLVFVLSCIIALLSMAVIGLAAATGIEAHRANTNANKMAAMTAELNSTSLAAAGSGPGLESPSGSDSDPEPEPGTGSNSNPGSKSTSDTGSNSGSNSDSDSDSNSPGSGSGSSALPGTKTVTVSAAVTTETIMVKPTSAISAIDDGCSENPEKVHGSTYTSYKRFNALTFTRYCQRDPKGTVLLVLFTSNFEQCMDACAAYSTYLPESFPAGGSLTKCDGLSFIPEWADKAVAGKENSRGNCYLKSGVKGEGDENGKKVQVHAAVLKSQ